MTDQSDADFDAATQKWLQGGAKKHDPNAAKPDAGGDKLPGQDAIETLGAFGQGALKSVADMAAPPFGKSLQDADPKGPVMTWANSTQKEHPWAEQAGRWAGEYGPLALLPDLDVGALAGPGARAVASAYPKLSHLAERGLQGAWKGAVGGETQGNAGAGAEAGGGSAALAAGYKMLPSYLQWGLPFAAAEGARELYGGGGRGLGSMYGMFHLAHPLAALAAALAGGAPGVSGALGAKAVGPANDQAK